MTKVTFIRKLSGYFLSTLLLIGNAWCASEIDIPYLQYESMKMERICKVVINPNASDDEKSKEIVTQFKSYLSGNPTPGNYSYSEDKVYFYIKDPLVLLNLRDQLTQAWNECLLSRHKFHIAEATLSESSVPEALFVISSVPTIYIYKDEGVSDFSARICEEAIAALESRIYATQRLNAEQTIKGTWRQNAAAYLMPGGADLSFCKKLNGDGNAQIKDYVTAGGTYIGFCAGAYYGSHVVEFNKGNIDGVEVIAERELSFFPGSAVGPVLAPYDPESKAGLRVADIKWVANDEPSAQTYNVYYNGGCHFKDAHQHPSVQVLATYANVGFEGLAAIVECQVGRGKALLSGVHSEYSAENLATQQPYLSADDWNHVQTNIIPRLSDGHHKDIFRSIMEQL